MSTTQVYLKVAGRGLEDAARSHPGAGGTASGERNRFRRRNVRAVVHTAAVSDDGDLSAVDGATEYTRAVT